MSARSVGIEVLGIVGAFAGVAALEIALHWYMGNAAGGFLWNLYLYQETNGKLPFQIMLDVLVPNVLLGALAGYLCRPWGNARLLWYTACLATGTVELRTVYLKFVPRRFFPSWPPATGGYILVFLTTWGICVVMAIIVAEHVSKRANVVSSKN